MKKIYKYFSKYRNISRYIFKNWKRFIIAFVILVFTVFIYKRITSEPAGVLVESIYKTELVNEFSANGKIRAKKEANLKFYSPGKVAWVGVKNGDKVNAWQSVASLNTILLNSAYQQALNNLRNYQAIAEKVLDDVKDHSDDETFTQKATRTTAEVNRDNAYDAVIAAQDNLRNAVLISPISGTVVDTNNLVSGLNLSGADIENKYIRVVDLSSLYFEANVDEVDFSKVKSDQEVRVTTDAYPDKSCSGRVSFIGKDGEVSSGGVVTIPVEVNLTNCNLDFVAGLNGQAHFIISKLENVLTIPKKYIIKKDGLDYVWKQVGEKISDKQLVPVTLGSSSLIETEITSGLSEGDTVIFIP